MIPCRACGGSPGASRADWRYDEKCRACGAYGIDPGGPVADAPVPAPPAPGDGRDPAAPAAPPLPGRSLVPAFHRDGALPPGRVFFHHDQNRALRDGDWKLVAGRPATNQWQLFNLRRDRAESRDLAARHPDRVRAMAAEWERLERTFRAQATATNRAGVVPVPPPR